MFIPIWFLVVIVFIVCCQVTASQHHRETAESLQEEVDEFRDKQRKIRQACR